jgi:hypothetical protein
MNLPKVLRMLTIVAAQPAGNQYVMGTGWVALSTVNSNSRFFFIFSFF